MSAQKGRPVTPAQREARRRNGQKTRGPCTPMGKKIVSMNAVKHGLYSCPPISTMAVLGENPIEYLRLVTGLMNSFHPSNPAEMTMLEDIAQLHWQRWRNQLARGARISLAVERLEAGADGAATQDGKSGVARRLGGRGQAEGAAGDRRLPGQVPEHPDRTRHPD